NHHVNIDVRNKFFKSDIIEVLSKKGPARQDKINDIIDINGQSLSFAPQGSEITISLSTECSTNDLIRKVGLATESQESEVGGQRAEVGKTATTYP
ncbi:MAG: U32 family peptidase C-terminal domain-containing protein, partial [Deltaproteobacteria bacterium]|nr:U32 family peptidase C-terminal domain-containing protein [Deltaproteobacteria bacterium]